MTESPLEYLTIAELGAGFRSGRLSPVTLAERLLERAERLNGPLHSFVTLTRERALAEARAAELALKAGRDLGPLHGIPYAVKDLYDVKGLPTQAGCRLLADAIAAADCPAVQRLSEAGMVLLGKTHTVQFAFGGVGINHDTGTPHNPWHAVPHAPGGSSSGSGVAVAAGLAPVALGSDTGGSVRIPAACNGTVGLKTTVGRISRRGVYPLCWSLDTVGPLTRSVEDAALTFMALQGVDFQDETTLGVPPLDALGPMKKGVKGLRLAFGETLFFDDVDPAVEKAVRGTGEVFRSLGAHVSSQEVPEVREATSNPKRAFFVAAEALIHNKRLVEEHFDELDPVVAHRLATGKELSASDYFVLQRQTADLRRRVVETLRDVDALLVPTLMLPPLPISEIDASPDTYGRHNQKYLRNTLVGNTLNLCAVSVPCGLTAKGLPIGLMVYAKPFQEDVALRVAYAYGQATEWAGRHPDLAWAG